MDFKRIILKNPLSQLLIRTLRYSYYPLYRMTTKNNALTVVGPEETVAHIIQSGKSISRFGDGEFNLMLDKKGIGFQSYTPSIAAALTKAFMGGHDALIALPHGFKSTRLDRPYVKSFWWSYVVRNKAKIERITSMSNTTVYYDTNFTRTATELKDKDQIKRIVAGVKSIWDNSDVLMVEGENTKFGIGNDLFARANSVSRIIAPEENAFEKISQISECISSTILDMKQHGKKPVVLMALGPTASILAVEHSAEAQCIDIGHFDLQYESFLRGTSKVIQVDGKYNNESMLGNHVNEVFDSTYAQQIICKL